MNKSDKISDGRARSGCEDSALATLQPTETFDWIVLQQEIIRTLYKAETWRSADGDGFKRPRRLFFLLSLSLAPLIASMSSRAHCCTNTPFIHTIDLYLTFKFCPLTTTVCSVYSCWECVGRAFTYKASAEAADRG